MMNLQIDPRWTIFSEVNDNFDDFVKTMVPDIYLRPEVHKDVKDAFKVIYHLLEHSFYCYEFYDVAVTQSVLTLEMALKIRFSEVCREKAPRNLLSYLQWFHDRSYFEVIYPPFLDYIRTIRNHKAHPTQHAVSGPMGAIIIENVIDLINALYEDPQLRAQRIKELAELRKQLENFNGEMLISTGDQKQLCFNAWIAFIDNKTLPPEIHLYHRPCFELQDLDLDTIGWIEPPVVYFKAIQWQQSDPNIIFQDASGQTLTIAPVANEHDRVLIKQWKSATDRFLLLRTDCVGIDNKRVDPFRWHLHNFNRK